MNTYMHIKINPNGGSLIERKLEFIIIIINFLSDKDKATLPKRCGGWLGPKGTTKTHLWVKNNPVHSCVVGKWSDEQAGCHRWDAAAQTSKQQSLRKATHTHTRARGAVFYFIFWKELKTQAAVFHHPNWTWFDGLLQDNTPARQLKLHAATNVCVRAHIKCSHISTNVVAYDVSPSLNCLLSQASRSWKLRLFQPERWMRPWPVSDGLTVLLLLLLLPPSMLLAGRLSLSYSFTHTHTIGTCDRKIKVVSPESSTGLDSSLSFWQTFIEQQ